MPKVFISYSHDSEEHKGRVRKLADELRAEDLAVIIDQDMIPLGGPAEGWGYWSEQQVCDADRVLIVCTEQYCKRYEAREKPGIGLGAVAEARMIHQLLYNTGGVNLKFRPIIFVEDDYERVPITLQTYHRYPLYREGVLAELLMWLTGKGKQREFSNEPQALHWPIAQDDHVWDLANRKEITARLVRMLNGKSRERILSVSAVTNSGKTHLLAEVKAYAARLPLACSLLDCKGCPSLDELFRSMLLDLGSLLPKASGATGSARLYSLIEDLQGLKSPVLLIFDTYEQASDEAKNWIESQLLLRLDRAPGVVAIVAGQQVPQRGKQAWASLAEQVTLQPIREANDWLEYSHRRWQGAAVNLDYIKALTLATAGNPGQLSALLETMMIGLQSGANV